jgi:hypothetical protein
MGTKEFDYQRDNARWVLYGNSKQKKVKLRKFISDKALFLSKFNGHTLLENKTALIEAYNEGGLKKIKEEFNKAVENEIARQKQLKEEAIENFKRQIKIEENEQHQQQ